MKKLKAALSAAAAALCLAVPAFADIAVEPEKAQACFSSIGQELRALELPVSPGVCPDGIVDSCIAATWQDSGEVFTNNYCGDRAQSIFIISIHPSFSGGM